MQGYLDEITRVEASAIWIAIFGFILLIAVKIAQGVLANSILEKKYSEWLSDKSIHPGMQMKNYIYSSVFSSVIMIFTVIHYSFPGLLQVMDTFPTHPEIRLFSIKWIEIIFDYAVVKGDVIFTAITIGIRSVLDFLELLFVKTPWIVIITAIVTLTGLSAGPRAAIYSAGFLAYMGFLGFWVKAMTTLALLGTAAILSIAIGIPLGIFCARRQRFYSLIRPIMDFMQTMPAFVFMIPVIAFFGTGKVAAVIITMIFGGTPVVRLTVLGLRGVPETIREAAIAYGATIWYLLRKVDLPLATPSILAGVNQTVMLSLAIGIPLGIFCARRQRFYSLIRPIMDFMQTMPAFVFMIPVIAFFGTGKVAAVIITMIFGGTHDVRLTVLGLRGVPETIREAAIAYGATKWYLLRKVDLPLATPSILAGVNQTVMLSLAMVVVASLIGAKGLGQDVLEALQYANVGQGILAGIAILFVALILDRVVQGKKRV